MTSPFLARAIALALVVVCACYSAPLLLRDTCHDVYERLDAGPHTSLTSTVESFIDDGTKYRGCVIHVAGDARQVTAAHGPDRLFGDVLPYCPGGVLPADLPPDVRNEDGWCADRIADGPDGTSYRALKENVFCLVEGRWDGGDDGDPSYVPSPRYDVVVKCASK